MQSLIYSRQCTRRALLLGVAGVLAAGVGLPRASGATPLEERADLASAFTVQNATGTFVVQDTATGRVIAVNAARAAKRFIPASTFKVANSLIALETSAVADEDEIIPYGGKPQPIKTWERDMSMRDAIGISNVPIYQELARRVGLGRYREWLDRLNYGNRQIGNVVDRFWLDGPLEISAIESAAFLARLAQSKLPASARSQKAVRDIMRLEQKDGRTLYGKTGWQGSHAPQIGWWVGWVESANGIHAFALNMDTKGPDDLPKRLSIARELLGRLAIY
jgi:beta-lactamase class D